MDHLLSLPSVSSANAAIDMSNRPVVEYLAECFEALGFECQLIPSPSSSSEEKLNLLATLGSGPGGLVLSGHTDTVPLNEELWSVNPFGLTEKNGLFYGLGSTDMKGFFPLVMEAVKSLDTGKLKEPLIVLATADEETSMYGARTLAEKGLPRARSAVIGEPTGLIPVRAHKGIMMESLRILGQSGHSSDPSLGNNALDAMHRIITDLMDYRLELKDRYHQDLFQIPHPTLNLGCIHGGDNPNRICGHCELEFDVRLTPGMNIESVREEIRQRARKIGDELGVQTTLEPLFPGVPAFFTESNSPLLQAAEKLSGHEAISVAFGTEGPHLQALGLDTIVMGPGSIDQAHQPDEYMSMDMINPCVDLLRKLIQQQCMR